MKSIIAIAALASTGAFNEEVPSAAFERASSSVEHAVRNIFAPARLTGSRLLQQQQQGGNNTNNNNNNNNQGGGGGGGGGGPSGCPAPTSGTNNCCSAQTDLMGAIGTCTDAATILPAVSALVFGDSSSLSPAATAAFLDSLCASTCWTGTVVPLMLRTYGSRPWGQPGCADVRSFLPTLPQLCMRDTRTNTYCSMHTGYLSNVAQQLLTAGMGAIAKLDTRATAAACRSSCIAPFLANQTSIAQAMLALPLNATDGTPLLKAQYFIGSLNLLCSQDPADGAFCAAKVATYLNTSTVQGNRRLQVALTSTPSSQPRGQSGGGGNSGTSSATSTSGNNGNYYLLNPMAHPEFSCDTCGRQTLNYYFDIAQRGINFGINDQLRRNCYGQTPCNLDTASRQFRETQASINLFPLMLNGNCGVVNGKVCMRYSVEALTSFTAAIGQSSRSGGGPSPSSYPSGVPAANGDVSAGVPLALASCLGFMQSAGTANPVCSSACATGLKTVTSAIGCCFRGFINVLTASLMAQGSYMVNLAIPGVINANVTFPSDSNLLPTAANTYCSGVNLPTCAARTPRSVATRLAGLNFTFVTENPVRLAEFKTAFVNDVSVAIGVRTNQITITSVQRGSVVFVYTVTADTDAQAAAAATAAMALGTTTAFTPSSVVTLSAASPAALDSPSASIGVSDATSTYANPSPSGAGCTGLGAAAAFAAIAATGIAMA